MKKTISLFLSIVMLFSALTASVNAYAAGFAPYAKNAELNTWYSGSASRSDYYNSYDREYADIYKIKVPVTGTISIKFTSEDDMYQLATIEDRIIVYNANNTERECYSEYRALEGYDAANGYYYSTYKTVLNAGTYYVMATFCGSYVEWNDYKGTYDIIFNYSPSISKPSGFKVKSRNTSSINLTWNKVGGATGYHLQRKINGNYSFVTNTSKNYYNVTGLRAGIRYDFRIRTFVEINGTRYYSGWTYFQTPTKPNKPAIKAPKTNWNDDIIIYWNKVSACSGYQVQYSRTSNFSKISYTKYTSYRNSSFTGHNFWYGYRYYVRVRAYKEVNGVKCFGAWSDSRSIVCQ